MTPCFYKMSLSNSDSRLTELLNWLQNDLELPVTNVLKAASDASFRRYFRIFNANGSYIAMDAPPGLENTASFIRIATLFKSAQLRTPEIFARN